MAVLVAVGLAGFLLTSSAPAQTNPSPRILFLQLSLKGDVVSIIATNARPGTLKTPPSEPVEALHFELLAAGGKKVWGGSFPDPLVKRLESEDPQKPGNLKAKAVRLPEAEFTIRVPLLPDAETIQFYRLKPGVKGSPGGPVRQPLNRLPLVAQGGTTR